MKTKRIITFSLLGLIALLVILGMLSGFVTDLWWFSDLGMSGVFWTSYEARYALWIAGFVLAFAFLAANARYALRAQPALEVDERFASLLAAFGRAVTIVVYAGAVLLAVIMAGTLSANWMDMLSCFHAEQFGHADPVFGKDIGFYIFTLPFILDLKNWLIAVVVLALIGVIIAYVVRQGISFAVGRVSLSSQARRHIAVLAGLLFVLIGVHFFLDR
jgi:uncharacterized membrane protein (UPF0182 family)